MNTTENTVKFQVVTADSFRVVADGFKSYNGACGWAEDHDWGQYENDGGLIVRSYTV